MLYRVFDVAAPHITEVIKAVAIVGDKLAIVAALDIGDVGSI